MKDTWRQYSTEVLGYVAPQTPVNEEYVATVKIQTWRKEGKSVREVALLWNKGNLIYPCSKGVNDFGAPYDSCEYATTVVAYYHK